MLGLNLRKKENSLAGNQNGLGGRVVMKDWNM